MRMGRRAHDRELNGDYDVCIAGHACACLRSPSDRRARPSATENGACEWSCCGRAGWRRALRLSGRRASGTGTQRRLHFTMASGGGNSWGWTGSPVTKLRRACRFDRRSCRQRWCARHRARTHAHTPTRTHTTRAVGPSLDTRDLLGGTGPTRWPASGAGCPPPRRRRSERQGHRGIQPSSSRGRSDQFGKGG